MADAAARLDRLLQEYQRCVAIRQAMTAH